MKYKDEPDHRKGESDVPVVGATDDIHPLRSDVLESMVG